jgi:hypothetical protein
LAAGRRASTVFLLVGALALGAAQPAFATAATSARTSAPTPALPASPAAAVSTQTDGDWTHSEHYVPSASPSAGAAARAPAPINAANEHLNYYGGRVIVKPAVYLIFWGPQWNDGKTKDTNQLLEGDAATYVKDFFLGLGGSPWLNNLTQYCQGPILVDCSKVPASDRISNPSNLVRTPLSCIGKPDCVAIYDSSVPGKGRPYGNDEILKKVHDVWLQENRDSSAVYFVFTPSGLTASDLGDSCGYHGWMQKGPPADRHGPPKGQGGESIWYSYVPYQADGYGCWATRVNSGGVGAAAL